MSTIECVLREREIEKSRRDRFQQCTERNFCLHLQTMYVHICAYAKDCTSGGVDQDNGEKSADTCDDMRSSFVRRCR